MGNFNLKNIWAPKAGGGGSIPSNLEQRVQELESNTLKLNGNHQVVNHSADFFGNVVFKNEAFVDRIGNGPTNIPNKEYVDTKIQKRIIDVSNTQGNTYTLEPAAGYEIISVMVGRKRTSDGFYFFTYNANLNFQVFLHTDGTYRIYTQGPVAGFDGNYRIIVVEKKL